MRWQSKDIYREWHLGFFNESFQPHNRHFDSSYGYLNGKEDLFDHNLRGSGSLIRRDGIYSQSIWNSFKVHGTIFKWDGIESQAIGDCRDVMVHGQGDRINYWWIKEIRSNLEKYIDFMVDWQWRFSLPFWITKRPMQLYMYLNEVQSGLTHLQGV